MGSLVRVRDLPVSTLPEAGGLGAGAFLVCMAGCEGEWSATRGDYFMSRPDHVMRCECGEPLDLVRWVSRLIPVQS